MRALDAAELAAIVLPGVVARDFLWVTATDRDTGLPVSQGFWSDVGTITASVVDGRTGATESRDFYGVAGAIVVGSIPLTADITIRQVDIELPAIDDVVALLVRGYDVRNAPLQLYRGYFDVATRALLAAAKPRFVGYVDGSPIVTPKEGDEGKVTLNCVSTTRELTRISSEVRSHESQIKRSASDTFFKDAGTVGDWDIAWGTKRTTPGNASGTGSSKDSAVGGSNA